MSEQYEGRQFVGMDLHRRRSVLVRMTETGEQLETVRIFNDPEYLRRGDGPCRRGTRRWCSRRPTAGTGPRTRWPSSARDVHLAHPLGVKAFSLAAGEERPVDRTTGPDLSAVRAAFRCGWLGSVLMVNDGDAPRELSGLVVPQRGSLEATGDLFEPYRLVDGDGVVVGAGGGVLRRVGGVRAAGDDAAVVWDGSAALVPVLVGGRGGLGPGDSGRGPGFLPLAAGRGQAGAAALAVIPAGDARGSGGGGRRPGRRTR